MTTNRDVTKWWYVLSISLVPVTIVILIYATVTYQDIESTEPDTADVITEVTPPTKPISAIETINRKWNKPSFDNRATIDTGIDFSRTWKEGTRKLITLLQNDEYIIPPAYQLSSSNISTELTLDQNSPYFCILLSNITYSGLKDTPKLHVRYGSKKNIYKVRNSSYTFCAESVPNTQFEFILYDSGFWSPAPYSKPSSLNKTAISNTSYTLNLKMLKQNTKTSIDIKSLAFHPNSNSGDDKDKSSPKTDSWSHTKINYRNSVDYKKSDATDYYQVTPKGLFTSLIIWGDKPLTEYLRVTNLHKKNKVVGRIHKRLPIAVAGSIGQEALLLQFQAGHYPQNINYGIAGYTDNKDQRKRLIVEFIGTTLPNLKSNSIPLSQNDIHDAVKFLIGNFSVEFTEQDIQAVTDQDAKALIKLLVAKSNTAPGE